MGLTSSLGNDRGQEQNVCLWVSTWGGVGAHGTMHRYVTRERGVEKSLIPEMEPYPGGHKSKCALIKGQDQTLPRSHSEGANTEIFPWPDPSGSGNLGCNC